MSCRSASSGVIGTAGASAVRSNFSLRTETSEVVSATMCQKG